MTPTKIWWALLVVLTLGFGAGRAAAQSDDSSDDGGGWFDESDSTERPQLKIHGKGQYDPPPADFRSEPAAPTPTGPEAIADDERDADEEADTAESQQQAVREFSPHLASYGYWVDDPFYGRVWVPSRGVVGGDFRPYVSGGHWELTSGDDWLWVSDYPFGWVTFHYGRWAWLSGGVGWGWVPGYVYSPAWVDFRIGSSGYVGWGPAAPYSVWRGGVFISLGARRPVPYIFCPTTYVFSPTLHRHIVYDRYRVRSIAAQSYRYRPRYVAGSTTYVRGPSPREARIPSRYVPTRRVIAQPRGGYVASEYRGRGDSRRYDSRPSRPSSPSESRYRTAPVERSRVDRGSIDRGGRRDVRTRSQYDGANMAPSQRMQGRSNAPPARGQARQGWASPPSEVRQRDNGPRDAGRQDAGRQNAGRYERRDSPPARSEAPRQRAPERSAADRRSDNRRSAPAAAPSRSSRGGGGATQQRSRSNDRDGRR
ncbi:MAG TPA: DUF6600 domain-containing protein [Polyangiaceae bacterium]|nr:DUF6600 domain-containing protein [Polyangiaceae bacterium]